LKAATNRINQHYMNNITNIMNEKITVYRVDYRRWSYNEECCWCGDYCLSREDAHRIADAYEKEYGMQGTRLTSVEEIEVELSAKGICDAMNELVWQLC
jgi:hypothetical protein